MYHQFQHYGNNDQQQNQQLQTNTPPYGYSPFYGPLGTMMNPDMQHLSPPTRTMATSTPSHGRHRSEGSSAPLRYPSRSLSPQFRPPLQSQTPANFEPTDRSLPSKDVTADTITDAYVAFILYCNPNFPLDVDTSTLRTNFQSPPKSDNKDFEVRYSSTMDSSVQPCETKE
jgi:hypothetical protein